MYPQIFSAAKEVDQAFLIILGFAVFILVAVTVAMLYFLWRYDHKRNPHATDIKGSVWLEIIWTVLPTIIVLGLFWTGWTSFKAMRTIPEGAMTVSVEGRMWSWRFTYENGRTSNELVIPVNTPVRLALASRDVIHSFYVPAMRVKWDLVPGMETDAWLQSDTLGDYDIFCAEYCGLKHADMITLLRVLDQEEFDAWLAEGGAEEGEDVGLALLKEFGCFDCHSMDLSEDAAPSLLDLGGREQTVVLPDGTEKTIRPDADFIRQSVREPGATLVKGWGDEMPPYGDELSDAQLDAMIAYLLKPDRPDKGQALADELGCLGCHTTDGTDDVGPSFLGLYGSERKGKTADGKPYDLKADDAYLRRAIVEPSANVPEGFDDAMPIYDDLDQATLDQLLGYLKSLAGEGGQ
ncbi:cytochrome c oxidase subunit II [Pseudodesulfovibrio indicus]|uniref:Cytochrome c oxidase subunit 2 n=1 Tax=Pseudodesulfovibrio indicus TaxID=1716143 RepID=A0A126QS60_9BACT|nr:cytochrome c oxidase subunit II [Pseudodesulfovibrio indicus]AMK12618.1 cytochrome c oxidase subunit II [Pseudodesulfovibrio indicus]TDT90930.1 cytochrome c oxidase subunit 2 [Pseudodesulfovibrio indicus]